MLTNLRVERVPKMIAILERTAIYWKALREENRQFNCLYWRMFIFCFGTFNKGFFQSVCTVLFCQIL